MPNPSDEVKAKLDIVEVIREYVPLKAAGFNFRAPCPFHREKTPSFMVSPEKQIWHCFGCGKGGDVFAFVMEIEGLTFVEALRLLAKKAGVTLKKADPALTSKRNRLLDAVDLAVRYYHKFLMENPAAGSARQYLKSRGLTDEAIEKWQIGCSPDAWDALGNFLKSKGLSEEEIFLAGLSVKKDKAPGFYDRFRGRVMFPLYDLNGQAVGFSARVMPGREEAEKMGKYINSPATMIYDKSKILFGLDKAKLAIKAEDAAVLVEGQMDAITAQENGFLNTVASSGTALTGEQVKLLKRYSNNLFLSFDMDQAGEIASERGIAAAMAAEMQIKVIEITGAKDPDEFIKKDPEGWRRAIGEAKPMMRYYFDKTFAKLDLKDFEGQSRAVKILLPVIARFGSALERDYWLKKLSQAADADEMALREKLAEILKRTQAREGPAAKLEPQADTEKISREVRLSEMLLALAIRYPAQLEYCLSRLSPEELAGEDSRQLYSLLSVYYNKLIDLWTRQGGNFDLAINYLDLKDWLVNSENAPAGEGQAANLRCASLLDRLVLLADKDFYDYTPEQAKAEVISLAAALRLSYLNSRRRQLAKALAEAEKQALPAEEKNQRLNGLLEEFKALTEEINLLEIK